MAERRMFAKTIIDSDAFLDMPTSTRLLYYDLGMRADDDGFVNSPKKIMRSTGATNDDMNILIMRKFIIPFESGIVVIKHWRIHNYIRKDTYNETPYSKEKSLLSLDKNKAYTLSNNTPVDGPSTQVRLGKVRLGKVRLERESNNDSSPDESTPTPKQTKHKHGLYKHVLLTDNELQTLSDKFGDALEPMIQKLDDYLSINKKSYKSHFNVINHGWIRDWAKEHGMLDHVDIKIAEYNKPIEAEEVEIDDDIQKMLSSLD